MAQPEPTRSTASPAAPARREGGWLHVARVVVSMLFMIGRARDFDPDAPTIGPGRFIVMALVVAALLLGGLVLLATSIAG